MTSRRELSVSVHDVYVHVTHSPFAVRVKGCHKLWRGFSEKELDKVNADKMCAITVVLRKSAHLQ